MPVAIDTFSSVAASGTVAAVVVPFVPATGDTFTVRNSSQTGKAVLEAVMGHYLQANPLRVRSPLLHDNVQGLRYRVLTGDSSDLTADYVEQQVEPQDTLIWELLVTTAPGVTENEVAVGRIYYSDLPGASARIHSVGDVVPNVKSLVTVEIPVVVSGTAGTWADVAVNNFQDLLHANTDYAVLGYETDTLVASVAVKGPDTSNLRIGGPGITDRYKTRQHFMDLSQWYGTPHIPVFNSANKAGTFVSVSSRLIAGTVNITLNLAEMMHPLA